MHVKKFKRNDVHDALVHDESSEQRAKCENIDSDKTKLNYNLLKTKYKSGWDVYKSEFKSGKFTCLKRADVNTLCSVILTAPDNLPKNREKEFFTKAFLFFKSRYEYSPCVSAWVHYDTGDRPHLDYKFIPIAPGKKGLRVNSNDLIALADLCTLHQDFKNYIDSEMSLNLNILTDVNSKLNDAESILKSAEQDLLKADEIKIILYKEPEDFKKNKIEYSDNKHLEEILNWVKLEKEFSALIELAEIKILSAKSILQKLGYLI